MIEALITSDVIDRVADETSEDRGRIQRMVESLLGQLDATEAVPELDSELSAKAHPSGTQATPLSFEDSDLPDEIIQSIESRHRDDFRKLIKTGNASQEFLTALNENENLQRAYDAAFDLQMQRLYEFRRSVQSALQQAKENDVEHRRGVMSWFRLRSKRAKPKATQAASS